MNTLCSNHRTFFEHSNKYFYFSPFVMPPLVSLYRLPRVHGKRSEINRIVKEGCFQVTVGVTDATENVFPTTEKRAVFELLACKEFLINRKRTLALKRYSKMIQLDA
ncbi:hypothetical protein CDAR_383311 [Caerostris darwini]|uniref:Uncharacterized protein n=1 Tax=Caerostris darwini TaxID=1538125 RepID=A0AAV4NVF6_9ARAC|nr:hypothetical protein CDAR_383311 [Caerostris darwini]